jgi:hypothetical protein
MTDTITPDTGERDLELAKAQLFDRIEAAKAEHPNSRYADLAARELEIAAPYAKEKRLIAGEIAAHMNVVAIGTPNLEGGYRRGCTVTLYGFKRDIDRAIETITAATADAFTAIHAGKPAVGEDVATYRSSVLLGYRLGLVSPDLDRETVETEVAEIKTGDWGVWMRSTGSGAWTGYAAGVPRAAAEAVTEPTDTEAA